MNNSAAALLNSIDRMRARLLDEPYVHTQLEHLQSWQLARLQQTYADYNEQPRYRDALNFFVRELYGPHDYSQRDRDLSKVLKVFERALPESAMHALLTALELEALSQELDVAMLPFIPDLALSPQTYIDAYRSVGRRADRERQIKLIVEAGRALDEIAQTPAVGAALWAARIPAKLARITMLQAFLERGYQAFSRMHGADELLDAIAQRETIIMHKLLSGTSRPFEWQLK